MQAHTKFSDVLVLLSVISVSGIYGQECPATRFLQAADTDDFPSGSISPSFTRDVFACVANCYNNRECMAVSFDRPTGQCYLFPSYMTQTTGGTRIEGAKYLTLDIPCGPSHILLPREYWRDDVIITSRVTCEETEVFIGVEDALYCKPLAATWTSANGSCVTHNLTEPLKFNGVFLQAVDSKLTIIGTPPDTRFDVTFVADGELDYLLKTVVIMDLKAINRMTYIGNTWSTSESDIAASFPFAIGKTFTMEFVSTRSEFTCTVDGQFLFSFQHRLPRESVNVTRINLPDLRELPALEE